MKLLEKTSKYYFIFLSLFSLLTIIIFYYSIQFMVYDDIDEKLKHESERINYSFQEQGKLPSSNYIVDIISIKDNLPYTNVFKDTLIYEMYEKDLIPYRNYEFYTPIGKERYKITLRNILLDSDDLIRGLFVTTALILLLMLTGLFF